MSLSKVERHVHSFIISETQKNGFPPSLREIAEEIGYSLRWAELQVQTLQANGYLRVEPKTPRGYQVLRDITGSPVKLAFVGMNG